MATLLQDLRYGLRTLAKNPGFALVAMLTLALGIGANTTIFSVLSNTILRELPFPNPERLMLVLETQRHQKNNWNIVSAPNFWDFERMSQSFESMAIFDSAGRGYNLSATGSQREPEQVSGLRVSAGFFPTLGAKPLLGRGFLKEEEQLGRDHEVVLSYGLWMRRYNGDASLIGRTIRIDGADFTVVGVMPREFQWEFWSGPRELYVPVGYTKTDFSREEHSFLAIGRMKPGVTEQQADADMESVGAALAREYPKENADGGARVMPLAEFGMVGIRKTMLALMGAVGFVLLIACVNVANLLLARGAARQKEFAIRRALGAGGWRIARQMLTESVLLAIAGGCFGLLLAFWSTRLVYTIFRLDQFDLPLRPIESLAIDGRVFAFAAVLACLTGIIFGLAPAIGALRGDLNDPLKEGGRSGGSSGRNRMRHVLVASEMALALVVLCGAGLMIKSMSRLLGVDLGMNAKNVLTMEVSVPQEIIYNGPPGLPRFCQDLTGHAGSIPGVLSVGAVAHLPLHGNAGRGFQIEGRPPEPPGHSAGGDYSVACPDYFRTMQIPIVRGREFTHQDTLNSQAVIVINQTMARDYWPNEDPIGHAVRLGGPGGPRLVIVGVVGDVHQQSIDSVPRRQFFRPYTQAAWPFMSIVARTAYSPLTFVPAVKNALADALPDRPVSDVRTMEDVVQSSTQSRRLAMMLLSAFSGIALVLAAVGIVGVVGHSVTQRTQEIGIRIALGAGAIDVLRLILSGSMAWVLVGIGVGVAGSMGLARLMEGLLFEVQPLDPWVLAMAAVLLSSVALMACYWPARRAAKIDPITALRWE